MAQWSILSYFSEKPVKKAKMLCESLTDRYIIVLEPLFHYSLSPASDAYVVYSDCNYLIINKNFISWCA